MQLSSIRQDALRVVSTAAAPTARTSPLAVARMRRTTSPLRGARTHARAAPGGVRSSTSVTAVRPSRARDWRIWKIAAWTVTVVVAFDPGA